MKYLIGFLAACVLWLALLGSVTMPEYVVVDCGMAEWHPDVSMEIKQRCRELRGARKKDIA